MGWWEWLSGSGGGVKESVWGGGWEWLVGLLIWDGIGAEVEQKHANLSNPNQSRVKHRRQSCAHTNKRGKEKLKHKTKANFISDSLTRVKSETTLEERPDY